MALARCRYSLAALVTRNLPRPQGWACSGLSTDNKLARTRTGNGGAVAETSGKDWQRVKDKQTGQDYWWNKTTSK